MMPASAGEVAAAVAKRAAARPTSAALLPSLVASSRSPARACWALITGNLGDEAEACAREDGAEMSFELESDAPESA